MTPVKSRTAVRTLAATAALAVPLAVAAANVNAATGAASTNEPSVTVFDQQIRDGKINISYVYLPQNGYVVVYGASADGKPTGEPLGHIELKKGDHRDISVKLDKMPAAGTKLWASIYEDRDGKPGFAKGSDVSVWSEGRLPAENGFLVR
jgi:hypothetical protein